MSTNPSHDRLDDIYKHYKDYETPQDRLNRRVILGSYPSGGHQMKAALEEHKRGVMSRAFGYEYECQHPWRDLVLPSIFFYIG
jgi:hypothetical protein